MKSRKECLIEILTFDYERAIKLLEYDIINIKDR